MASSADDSSMKMSKAMSLAALRPLKEGVFSQSDGNVLQYHRHRHQQPRPAPPSPLSSTRKRPRTTRGKPHSDPSALRSCVSAKQEPLDSAFLPRFDPCSVKIEPADAHYFANDNYFIQQVPSTFFPIEHLLICPASHPSICELRCDAFPAFSSSPVTPLSSSLLCSSAADEFPANDSSQEEGTGFVTRHEDTSYVVDSFLGERCYEIERAMCGIMGEAVEGFCAPCAVIATELVIPKVEADHSENASRSDISNGISSADTSTTATTLTSEDVDYRIDLTDFEPDQEESAEAEIQGQRLRLTLNFDDVINAWSDRGSLFADGSWTRKVPEGCSLDLAAWELERVVPSTEAGSEAGQDGFYGGIRVADDGQSVEEGGGRLGGAAAGGGGGGSSGREARVMRYREKRRTRLFSKKIRYEVRKLNAERRPRMKGRFIKRTLD